MHKGETNSTTYRGLVIYECSRNPGWMKVEGWPSLIFRTMVEAQEHADYSIHWLKEVIAEIEEWRAR